MRLHSHRETVVHREVLPSAHEQLAAAGQAITNLKGNSSLVFRKDVVVTVRCTVCGHERAYRV